MSERELPLSNDAFYLDAAARMFGWDVRRGADEALVLSLSEWTVRALFWRGVFRYARATGPGTSDVELALREVLDVLEEHGSPEPPTP
ncbi:hypothetical protein ACFVX9_04130 [Kitasatospora sp. NPDC058243]|uniref:hypothetical protein n=1 Tax=Kitasatospora sp. NPDC058243 TaxID=3346397 RepID=UPI0036DD1FEC